jgi:hypothetical protein
MKTLEELADFYATDKRKSDHNYIQFYQKYFDPIKDTIKNILEIGILDHPDKIRRPYTGASLLMWQDYFPNAKIYGVDIQDFKKMNNERITTLIADQSNRVHLSSTMKNVLEPLNIIIDDGGHMMHQQQISFAFLFPILKSGGWYIIEDLHTSHLEPPFAPGSSQLTPDDTLTQDMLHDFIKTKKIVSIFMKPEEIKYLEENILDCIIEKGTMSEIAFIIKK